MRILAFTENSEVIKTNLGPPQTVPGEKNSLLRLPECAECTTSYKPDQIQSAIPTRCTAPCLQTEDESQ